MKIKILLLIFKILFLVLSSSTVVHAQIDMAYRRTNAVALYEFLETSGNIVRDTSMIGTPLDLTISDASSSAIERAPGMLRLKSRNLIQSAGPATKIINACQASGELTIEAWIQDSEPVQKLVGEYPSGTAQPNRIISLNTDIKRNNFYVGQFYDDAEFLYSAINTSGNEAASADFTRAGGSLNNPIISSVNQLIIPALEVNDPPVVPMQKIIVTLSKNSETARLYLTDRDGNISEAAKAATGFGAANGRGYFSNWYTNAKLSLGNVSSTLAEVSSAPAAFTTCTGDIANTNPSCRANSRYWKGRLHLIAIYCKALTPLEIVGTIANAQIQNKVIPINANVSITDNLKKAQDIFQRLTGIKTPLYDPVLAQMEARLGQNDPLGAAALATADPHFYNITVRDFASKMSNRSETINVPLNDFTATVVGAVRDEINSQRLLWDNITYVADVKKMAVPSSKVQDLLKSNNHYMVLDNQRADLANVLIPTTQKIYDGAKAVDMPAPAGLLTTRAWMSEHAVAGTNRRLVEFSLREFLCTPIEKAADSTGPDNVVARDIDRFPGGSHTKFTVSCRSCHTILDGFRPAFSHFTFNNNHIMHSFASPTVSTQADEDNGLGMFKSKDAGASYVHDKLNKNETVFSDGRITKDDNWINNAANGANLTYFNWKQLSGKGIKDFGKMLSESKQFPICMANRIYTQVCKRAPASSENDFLNSAATEFATQRNYNLKFLFQKIVTSKECLGGN